MSEQASCCDERYDIIHTTSKGPVSNLVSYREQAYFAASSILSAWNGLFYSPIVKIYTIFCATRVVHPLSLVNTVGSSSNKIFK